MPSPATTVYNIILFGESGSGKSSIVNLIVGKPVAEVSSGVLGCTVKHASYQAIINNTYFRIYDTPGLNGASQNHVPHWKAVEELYTLIRSLDGMSLLIYCMQGMPKESTLANWTLVNKVLCREEVPIIAVVTALEQEGSLHGKAGQIKKSFNDHRMFPKDVECIVSIRGRNDEYEAIYNSSRCLLETLIMESYRTRPWTTQTVEWMNHIYKATHTTKLFFFTETRLEFTQIIDKYIQEAGMKNSDSDLLKTTLLRAEKMVLKRKKDGQ